MKVEDSCAYNMSTLLSYIYDGCLAAKWIKGMFCTRYIIGIS